MSEGCEDEYEAGVLYDESQPGALVTELESKLPLKHRTLLMEAANEPVRIFCCEDDHIHLRYNPQEVSAAMLCLYTGIGYAIAMATDSGKGVSMPVRRQVLEKALREIDHTMEQFNPHYAQALRGAAPLLTAVFDGPITDALITPAPGAKRTKRVFEYNLPLSREAGEAMHLGRVLKHAFAVPTIMGSDLVTGNGIASKDERPS